MMGYRLPDHYQELFDVATKSIIAIDNGTISRISIPCFYSYDVVSDGKHREIHDHFGWPSPGNPDHSCQIPHDTGILIKVDEIDFADEGYTDVEIGLVEPPEGLSMTGTIDHNTILLVITAMCPSAQKEDVDVSFAAYVTDGDTRRDVVTKGVIHIVSGPLPETD